METDLRVPAVYRRMVLVMLVDRLYAAFVDDQPVSVEYAEWLRGQVEAEIEGMQELATAFHAFLTTVFTQWPALNGKGQEGA